MKKIICIVTIFTLCFSTITFANDNQMLFNNLFGLINQQSFNVIGQTNEGFVVVRDEGVEVIPFDNAINPPPINPNINNPEFNPNLPHWYNCVCNDCGHKWSVMFRGITNYGDKRPTECPECGNLNISLTIE